MVEGPVEGISHLQIINAIKFTKTGKAAESAKVNVATIVASG